MIKEVSPCNESRKFTVEGVLRDPEDPGKSAVLEAWSLGRTLSVMHFSDFKWSSSLGYAMGTLETGTRIHLHCRGKTVIRKAETKDDADDVFKWITSISKPSVICFENGTPLWEVLFLAYHREGAVDRDSLMKCLDWHSGGSDCEIIFDESLASYNELDSRIGSGLRGEIFRGETEDLITPEEIESRLNGIKGTWAALEGDGYDTEGEALGSRVFHLSVTKALEGFSHFISTVINRGEGVPYDELIEKFSNIWVDEDSTKFLTKIDEATLEDLRGLMKCIYFLNPAGRPPPKLS